MSWAASVHALNPTNVYAALFVLLVVEGMGVPLVPFEPVFLAAGLLIARGEASLALATLVGGAGNVAGNLIGYFLGRRAGAWIATRGRPLLGVGPRELQAVGRWFDRYGAATTFVSRFVGVIRTPAILAAGMAGMPLGRYTLWSALGGGLWCLAWLVASAAFGAPLLQALARSGTRTAVVTIAVLVLAAALYRRRRSRREPPGG